MTNKRIETETYAILNNLDWTITKLNPIIKNDGYEFVPITLQKLELNFSEVFNISREFKPNQRIVKSIEKDGFNMISDQFQDALKYYFTLHPGSEEYPPDHEVYLLKKITNTYTEKGESYFLIDEPTSAQIKITDYAAQFIRKLRLYKSGQIDFQGCFSIFKEDRHVISKYKTPRNPIWGLYTVDDSDLESINKLLDNKIYIPELLKLAIESFELAYDSTNPKIKFTILMMGLESIFNRSSQEPIKHIISRHLALTLATNEKEFDELYNKTKKLYNTRCDIVHGNPEKNKIEKLNVRIKDELYELEELTRKVIIKLLWFHDAEVGEPTRDSLFNYLNKKGYNI